MTRRPYIIVLFAASAAQADFRLVEPPRHILEDSTYEVTFRYIGDGELQKAGESSRKVFRQGDRIHTVEQTRVAVKVNGKAIRIEEDTAVTEDLDGRVLEFTQVDDKKRVTGKRVGSKIRVTQNGEDEIIARDIAVPSDVLTDTANVRTLLEGPLRIGKRWKLREFSVTRVLEGPRELEFEFLGRTTDDFDGKQIPTLRFRQTDRSPRDADDPWSTEFRIDKAGTLHYLELRNSSYWFGFRKVR